MLTLILAALIALTQPDLQAKGPYDTVADSGHQIAAAVKLAKRDNTRILLHFGGNWSANCLELHKLITTDEALKKLIRDEYQYILIDYGQPPGKNVKLADQLWGDHHGKGVPYLTVLDSAGRMYANMPMTDLEGAKSASGTVAYDTAGLIKFLAANKAPTVAAQAILDKGLAEAKKSDRRVFLHFGAPWCSWCNRLDAWLARPDIAPVLAKDFVDIKIDTDRFAGGEAILKKYNAAKESGGIPWFVILDADGKPIADSNNSAGQNIGFPSAPDEIAAFGALLKKTAKSLSQVEIDKLIATLRETIAEPAPSR